MLYELRLNFIKSGLLSSQICSKLSRTKLESYLHNFLKKSKDIDYSRPNNIDQLIAFNSNLKVLIDILFYFSRKRAKPSVKLLNTLNGNGVDEQNNKTSDNNFYNEETNAAVNNQNTKLSSKKKENDASNLHNDGKLIFLL